MLTYIATNTKTGKFYIGSTRNFERRQKQHLNSNCNHPFHNALKRDPDAFEWEVHEDDSEAPILEQALLDMWHGKECCYNLNPYADRPPNLQGHKFSEETLRKRSTSRKGKPIPSLRGRPLSSEHKNKISLSTKGRKSLKGDSHPSSKLSQKEKEEIREKYIPQGKGHGKGNSSLLAQEYGVCRKTIHSVVKEGKNL